MKKPSFLTQDPAGRIALRGGGYSLAATAIVLAICIALNVLTGLLPTSSTRYDISASKLYSVTSSTKAVLSGLEDDITIYWITQAGQENSVIENLLDKYESLSDHITVEVKNPDVYPTFAAQYTDETVYNNSLIVVCGDKSRYIAYDDIYVQELDYTTYSASYSFDGEGKLTSAIDYVTRDELPQLYRLTGHGEADLSEAFSDQLTKDNIEVKDFSLLSENGVPEDADGVLIYAPASDISEEEVTLLQSYVSCGGKLLVLAGPTENGMLTNLYGLLESCGVTTVDGVVVESDSAHYSFGYPYLLLPDMASSDLTDTLISEGYNVVLPIAQGLTVADNASGVTTLLTTSDAAFSKAAGYAMTTVDKEDGDTDGPFALAVEITDGSGEIIWFASSLLVEDTYNSMSSGANLNMVMNALSALIGEQDSLSIRSKSLSYNYLTISESDASVIKTLLIGVIPLCFVGAGIYAVIKRRSKRHE